jgi:hypothetical protein
MRPCKGSLIKVIRFLKRSQSHRVPKAFVVMVSQHGAPLTKAEGNDTHFETVAWLLSNQTHLWGAGGERLVILCKTGVRTLPYLRAGSADVLRFCGKEKETYGFQL